MADLTPHRHRGPQHRFAGDLQVRTVVGSVKTGVQVDMALNAVRYPPKDEPGAVKTTSLHLCR